MLASLQSMVRRLDEILATADPALVHAREAVEVVRAADEIVRRAGAVKTLFAARAAEAGTWSREGYRRAEEWFAALSGVSYGEAAATLETSAKLAELPATSEALRAGRLSGSQTREVATAATPDNEAQLLDAAKRQSHRELRRTCAKERARQRSSEDDRARHERIHRERFHRSWTDADGAYRYEGKTTAAVGARIDAAIQAATEPIFKAARDEGRRETLAAYRADAVERLVCEGGASVDTTVVIRVDADRLAGGAGVCETTTGPAPVDEAVGAILAGAFVKVVLRDGVDITKVAHHGRHVPAEVRTAVLERDGHTCVRPGCGATQKLELHHCRIGYAKRGPTAAWNLVLVCPHDHDLLTHRGHRLEGGPGNWTWIPPP